MPRRIAAATTAAVLALAGCGGDDERGGAPAWFPSTIAVPEGAITAGI